MTVVVRQKMASLASKALAILELVDHGPYQTEMFHPTFAKFASRCPACGVWIDVDEYIIKAYHPKAPHDNAIWIHKDCANRTPPNWPELNADLRAWLGQATTPYILIKKYDGGMQTCKLCGRSSSKIADVRKLGDFPFITRICQSCAGEE